MCTSQKLWWIGLIARDVAGDSGESDALSGGDDTVEICAVTVAHYFADYFSGLLLNCTLVELKISNIYMYWNGDRLPTIAIDEDA
jgi:hypothetical protein